MSDTLQFRLRKRAEIRRGIPRAERDRIADICDEAADRIDDLECQLGVANDAYIALREIFKLKDKLQ